MSEKIDKIIETLRQLTDDERLEIFDNFCRYCGCDDPKCQCWNDE